MVTIPFPHRPADDVGDRSSCSVGGVAVDQTMQDRSRSSTRILVDPAPEPHFGAKRHAHVSENATSELRASYIKSSKVVPTALATSRDPMARVARSSLSSGTSGGSVMPIRAGDQQRKFSLPEDQGGLKGGSQWHESVSFPRGQNSQTTGTMTATNSGIGIEYIENTSTNLQHQGWTNVYLHQLRVAHLLLSTLLKLVAHMPGTDMWRLQHKVTQSAATRAILTISMFQTAAMRMAANDGIVHVILIILLVTTAVTSVATGNHAHRMSIHQR